MLKKKKIIARELILYSIRSTTLGKAILVMELNPIYPTLGLTVSHHFLFFWNLMDIKINQRTTAPLSSMLLNHKKEATDTKEDLAFINTYNLKEYKIL